jgi:hypothetical protein
MGESQKRGQFVRVGQILNIHLATHEAMVAKRTSQGARIAYEARQPEGLIRER